ncbi:Glycosyl transferase, group I [Methanococcoides burtonii DSM 6242]|uniref:Glycosyl transferase, group I n=2 Tax=Methanococcoides burtonii TaxID=29291 RepID=Q12UH6_METBU|nr:Glycosyl transferase, group I [Methanococcoides burtonii DSM 6242]
MMYSNVKNDFKKYSGKNLLVIAPSYPNEDNTFIGGSFIKNQLESLKKHFDNIFVISPVLFSFNKLDKDKLCNNYRYDNINVYFPRSYYIPIFYFNKILIDNRLHVVEKIIKNENLKFDLIHAHFTWPSAYISTSLKEKYHVPTITTIHENAEWLVKEAGINSSLINNAWRNSDVLIRVNSKDLPILSEYNKNVISIPNGFSSKFKYIDKMECRGKLNLPKNKKIIFSLGGLIERKGFNYLIDAIKFVTKKQKDVLCFIGGNGPLKDALQKQIIDLNLQNNVKLVGFVTDELLSIWINSCDIFVLPSLSEGNPTVMFECLGCGKPYVGTGVGGVPEIITSDKYGLLVEPGNSQDLAEKIIIALNKEWDRDAILEYSDRFTWDNIALQTMDAYNLAIAKCKNS